MFSYNSHNRRDNLLKAAIGLIFEIVVVATICLGVLGLLNYYNVISFSSLVPFLSFLPAKGIHSQNSNYPSVPPAHNIPNIKKSSQVSIRQVVVQSQIAEISTKGGTVKTKKGIESYVVRLKLRSDIGEKTFYFEQKDLPQITVFKTVGTKEVKMSFDDLNVGDKVSMDSTYNPVTNDIISLKIVQF